jgi:hypothetical protein
MVFALAHPRMAERRHGEASFRSGTTSRSPAVSPRSISLLPQPGGFKLCQARHCAFASRESRSAAFTRKQMDAEGHPWSHAPPNHAPPE